ncbi:unnamed protein product [Camellia sinensis]
MVLDSSEPPLCGGVALATPVTCLQNETDRSALIAFKAAIDQDPFGALRSWYDSVHYCDWNGILCSLRHPNGVVKLRLRSQGLVGSLSPHIGNLSFLKSLILRNNSFHGPIPQEIGCLFRLRNISLSNNSFHGEVPTNFSQCSNLELLDLIDNNLTGNILAELGSLWKLTLLGLSTNKISGTIPHSLGNLSSLTELSLRKCALRGEIPKEIAQLQGVILFYIFENNIAGEVPSSIYNISTLSWFEIFDNQLRGSIPPDIGLTLPNLKVLFLPENKFTGPLPISLSNASKLQEIGFDHNNFVGPMPRDRGRLLSLRRFGVGDNLLEDDLSFISFLTNCTSLKGLSVSGNFLRGLTMKYMEACHQVLGSSSISVSLIRRKLFHNLSRLIPSYLSELHLEKLNLSFNKLHGRVPMEGIFRNESAISVVGNNDLCGGIPYLCLPLCPSSKSNKNKLSHRMKVILTVMVVLVLCSILLVCLFIFLHWRCVSRKKAFSVPSLKHHLLRVSYAELLKATDGFSEDKLIGVGNYGSVYKGILDQVQTIVAVKVLNLQLGGASKSFMSECKALRTIRIRNLLKILSACSSVDFQGNEFKALVYEFMANGSLEKWLHHDGIENNGQEEESRNLKLIQRVNIAIDVASAIECLHCHCD